MELLPFSPKELVKRQLATTDAILGPSAKAPLADCCLIWLDDKDRKWATEIAALALKANIISLQRRIDPALKPIEAVAILQARAALDLIHDPERQNGGPADYIFPLAASLPRLGSSRIPLAFSRAFTKIDLEDANNIANMTLRSLRTTDAPHLSDEQFQAALDAIIAAHAEPASAAAGAGRA